MTGQTPPQGGVFCFPAGKHDPDHCASRVAVVSAGALDYACRMRTALILVACALLWPGLASAVICEIVGPDDSVTYTDIPEVECPRWITPRSPSVVQIPPVPVRPPVQAPIQAEQAFAGYTDFAFIEPAQEGTVRSNDGAMTVVLKIEPALQPGHTVQLSLDGSPVAGGFDAPAIDLQGIERGTHRLAAVVRDAANKPLISAEPVTFTMRKASLNSPARPGLPVPRPLPLAR